MACGCASRGMSTHAPAQSPLSSTGRPVKPPSLRGLLRRWYAGPLENAPGAVHGCNGHQRTGRSALAVLLYKPTDPHPRGAHPHIAAADRRSCPSRSSAPCLAAVSAPAQALEVVAGPDVAAPCAASDADHPLRVTCSFAGTGAYQLSLSPRATQATVVVVGHAGGQTRYHHLPYYPDDKDARSARRGGRAGQRRPVVPGPSAPSHPARRRGGAPLGGLTSTEGVTSFNGGGAFGNDDNNLGVGATYPTAPPAAAHRTRGPSSGGQPGGALSRVCSSPVAEGVVCGLGETLMGREGLGGDAGEPGVGSMFGGGGPGQSGGQPGYDVRRRRGRQPQGTVVSSARAAWAPTRHRSGRRRRRRVLRRRRRRLKLRQRHRQLRRQ